jgi:transcriptional regulator with XRE-family HTH domain
MIGACEALPMTRAEIARATGVARSTITRLANGERGTRTTHQTVDALRALLPTGNT